MTRKGPRHALRARAPGAAWAVWVGTLTLFGSCSPEGSGTGGTEGPSADAPVETREPGSNIPVFLTACERRGDSLWAEGFVRNDGGAVVRYVQVELSWLDPAGDTVGSDITFAIGGEILPQGDTTGFRAATAGAATSCEATLYDYEPL